MATQPRVISSCRAAPCRLPSFVRRQVQERQLKEQGQHEGRDAAPAGEIALKWHCKLELSQRRQSADQSRLSDVEAAIVQVMLRIFPAGDIFDSPGTHFGEFTYVQAAMP